MAWLVTEIPVSVCIEQLARFYIKPLFQNARQLLLQ